MNERNSIQECTHFSMLNCSIQLCAHVKVKVIGKMQCDSVMSIDIIAPGSQYSQVSLKQMFLQQR